MHPKVLIFLTLFFLTPALCHGHKIRVFAWVEEGTIMGEASFHGGKKARQVDIIIQAQGQQPPLATTQTDDKGNFSTPLPDIVRNSPTDLLIIADSGDGHRNEWLIERSELKPDTNAQPHNNSLQAVEKDIPPNEFHSPTNRAMAEKRVDEISAKDILAGLSIIFGLAGLTLYVKKKRKRS